MPGKTLANLTEQQQKWFTAVREGLPRETGKTLAEWVAIARTCPETAHRARLRWFKETHGLLQNRASYVLSEAFPPETGWDTPDALRAALWSDALAQAILAAVEKLVLALPEVVAGQRKGFSAWSRRYQFAALRPVTSVARLGLALQPVASPLLEPARKEAWSERLVSVMVITTADQVTGEVAQLLKSAWEVS